MWEVLSRGCTPYSGIDNFDIQRYLNQGRRLEQPRATSNFVLVVRQTEPYCDFFITLMYIVKLKIK